MALRITPDKEMGQMVDPFAVRANTEGYVAPTTAYKAKAHQTRKLASHKLNRQERRMMMAGMCARGQTLRQIAEAFGVTSHAVAVQINALVEEYQEKALELIGKKIARELAILDMVQLEATIAWYESKKGRKVHNAKRVTEIRSMFVHGRGYTKINEKKRGANIPPPEDLARLFGVEGGVSSVDADAAFDELEAQPSGKGEMQVDKEEEFDRHETSAGDPRFLAIIIDCHEKRAKLEGMYKAEDGSLPGQDEYAKLNPEQRKGRLAKLAQDLRTQRAHTLAPADIHNAAGNVIEAQPVAVNNVMVNDGSNTGTTS